MTIQDSARLKAIQKGDKEAFELLFREFYKPLLRYAVSILKSQTEAEEIVQDVFFHLWKNKARLEITVSFSAYLFKAVHNNSLRVLRREQRKVAFESQDHDWMYHESMSPGEVMQYNEMYDKINSAVKELPENCQQIFRMNRFNGMKYSEIAEKLAISIKTVEANMTKALKHIKRHMSDYVAN